MERGLDVCPKCGHHLRIDAEKRVAYFLDAEDQAPVGEEIKPRDPLKFKDDQSYPKRISAAQSTTGSSEALVVKEGKLLGLPLVVCVFEFAFMGGSMGSVVGERFSQAAKLAIEKKCPLVCFSASGGARMQEGLFSLFQMAKTSSLIAQMKAAGIPFVSVLTDPVYGGVAASLANLGDVIIAEPNAMVGFAGPRVIEQTVREQLPTNFQTSEFLLEKGVIDMICPRSELRPRVGKLLQMLQNRRLPEAQSRLPAPLASETEAQDSSGLANHASSTANSKPADTNSDHVPPSAS